EGGQLRGHAAELGLGGGDRTATGRDLPLPAQDPLAGLGAAAGLGLAGLVVLPAGELGAAAGGDGVLELGPGAVAVVLAVGAFAVGPLGGAAQLLGGPAGQGLLDVLDEVAAAGGDELGGAPEAFVQRRQLVVGALGGVDPRAELGEHALEVGD